MTARAATEENDSRSCRELDLSRYDRTSALTPDEQLCLEDLVRRFSRGAHRSGCWPSLARKRLSRLLLPLDAVIQRSEARAVGPATRHAFVTAMHQFRSSFWGWTHEEWMSMLSQCDPDIRHLAIASGYMLTNHRDLHVPFPGMSRQGLVWLIFGRGDVEQSVSQVRHQLQGWGYLAGKSHDGRLTNALYEVMLEAGSPDLDDFTSDHIEVVRGRAQDRNIKTVFSLIVHVLADRGLMLPAGQQDTERDWAEHAARACGDVPKDWASWAQRWFLTSTLTRRSRESVYYSLLKAGRWLAKCHPDYTEPASWTRAVAANWVASVDRMRVGEWAHAPSTVRYEASLGKPLRPRTKDGHISALRTFFRDCQEWGWVPRQFDPSRALATPRAVTALIGPDPRVIDDDIWIKLMWAGLNLTVDDLPHAGHRQGGSPWYPLAMVRAVTLLWLFAGLRSNEIGRLRVGCIRMQPQGANHGGTPSGDAAVCLLDVPAHKTGTSFTKPVDRIVGEAIQAWERIRPDQPALLDTRTGEMVNFLFTYRGMRLGRFHVNRVLIPRLCRKANVPTSDARGRITSHRARSTIATQLYNAKEPMTLFELQAWLGHRSPATTQHYARISPTTLSRAYADAGYFARNVRAIEVLVDREAVTTGAVASGTPWQYFDLGHGLPRYQISLPPSIACLRSAAQSL